MGASGRENTTDRMELPDSNGRSDINFAVVSGRLGRHPENCIMRTHETGKRYLQIPLAVRNLEFRQGKMIMLLEWYQLRIVGPRAVDNTLQWCSKGDHVLVRGRVGSYRLERDGRFQEYQYVLTFDVLHWMEQPRKFRGDAKDPREDYKQWQKQLNKYAESGPRPGREVDNNLWEEYGDGDIPFDTED